MGWISKGGPTGFTATGKPPNQDNAFWNEPTYRTDSQGGTASLGAAAFWGILAIIFFAYLLGGHGQEKGVSSNSAESDTATSSDGSTTASLNYNNRQPSSPITSSPISPGSYNFTTTSPASSGDTNEQIDRLVISPDRSFTIYATLTNVSQSDEPLTCAGVIGSEIISFNDSDANPIRSEADSCSNNPEFQATLHPGESITQWATFPDDSRMLGGETVNLSWQGGDNFTITLPPSR